MGLTNKKEEQLKRMPTVEFNVFKSKDGRFMVHKTTITDIKPFAYYKKIVENPTEMETTAVVEE